MTGTVLATGASIGIDETVAYRFADAGRVIDSPPIDACAAAADSPCGA